MEIMREIDDGIKIFHISDVLPYLEGMGKLDREHGIVLGLDTKNKVIYREIVSIGTLNSTFMHPREVFKGAIVHSANGIILAHNHPSGDLTPSYEDIKIGKSMKDAGELLNISVIDMIILGGEKGYYSYLSEVN